MSTGDALSMAAVVAVAAVMAVLKEKVPAWLGFVILLVAGLVLIVGGAATGRYQVVPVGVAAVISVIVLWVVRATSQPAADDTLGQAASNMPWWAWLVVVGVVVVGFVVAFFIPASRA